MTIIQDYLSLTEKYKQEYSEKTLLLMQVGSFFEYDKLSPSNPYSASKACAEMLVQSYSRTYEINYIITRSSNNYGPRQFEEKLIPKIIDCVKNNKKVPVHGDGSYVRDWVYVKDNVKAVMHILKSGIRNECFNIGAKNYIKNIDVVKTVLGWFGKTEDCVQYVDNRWGQDVRYSIDNQKLINLGWKPEHPKGIYNWHEKL